MCRRRPCRCSVDLVLRVGSIETLWDICSPGDGLNPGIFSFSWVISGEYRYRQLWVVLPCEGGELHGLPLRFPDSNPVLQRPSWEWDGNLDRPTLKPSVLTWRLRNHKEPDAPNNREEVWHGFITAGRAVSC
jgi:hypothetical protein